MSTCSAIEMPIAASSQALRHGGWLSRDEFSESAFSALNISTTTSTDIEIVEGRESRKMAQEYACLPSTHFWECTSCVHVMRGPPSNNRYHHVKPPTVTRPT